ncbi:DUF3105 domain-containing protein [Streptomyces sp. NBC_00687]|uniref:DUF3105 domain-containing protein n=1 Tax=Streptomyces sp. NBC_00687 TaxID=2975807 RepID=UPI002259AB3A|nr:DUF3105 domain-containing protein [Streptomyces sp. NBC_00687]MCX4920032.1 DUF3105 domain-containing protein [Streptomyces sp. NBC_00687]
MGSSRAKQQRVARRAKIDEMRRAAAARDRRVRVITWSASLVIVSGIAAGAWYYVEKREGEREAEARAAAAPVRGEKSWEKLSRNHVQTTVDYKMSPAVGGDHDPAWMNCNGDVYDREIKEGNAVHALEHGAVWVTYNDSASSKDIAGLGARVRMTPYSLMSPYKEQASPITFSAWGKQLNVRSASDPRVEKFLAKYVQGKQTPEPGAACTGGKTV